MRHSATDILKEGSTILNAMTENLEIEVLRDRVKKQAKIIEDYAVELGKCKALLHGNTKEEKVEIQSLKKQIADLQSNLRDQKTERKQKPSANMSRMMRHIAASVDRSNWNDESRIHVD